MRRLALFDVPLLRLPELSRFYVKMRPSLEKGHEGVWVRVRVGHLWWDVELWLWSVLCTAQRIAVTFKSSKVQALGEGSE